MTKTRGKGKKDERSFKQILGRLEAVRSFGGRFCGTGGAYRFYFTIFMPFGLIVTLFSDQLDMKVLTPSWLERKTRDLTVEDARRLW